MYLTTLHTLIHPSLRDTRRRTGRVSRRRRARYRIPCHVPCARPAATFLATKMPAPAGGEIQTASVLIVVRRKPNHRTTRSAAVGSGSKRTAPWKLSSGRRQIGIEGRQHHGLNAGCAALLAAARRVGCSQPSPLETPSQNVTMTGGRSNSVSTSPRSSRWPFRRKAFQCDPACNFDPLGGVIGVQN